MKNILLAKKISQLKNNPTATKVLSTEEQNQVKGGDTSVEDLINLNTTVSYSGGHSRR